MVLDFQGKALNRLVVGCDATPVNSPVVRTVGKCGFRIDAMLSRCFCQWSRRQGGKMSLVCPPFIKHLWKSQACNASGVSIQSAYGQFAINRLDEPIPKNELKSLGSSRTAFQTNIHSLYRHERRLEAIACRLARTTEGRRSGRVGQRPTKPTEIGPEEVQRSVVRAVFEWVWVGVGRCG